MTPPRRTTQLPQRTAPARRIGTLIVVAGPPCAGKTTFVQQHAEPGDLVVDYDAIAAALGSADSHDHPASLRPFICEARDAVLARLNRPHDATHTWLIQGAPTPAERHGYLGARVVVLATEASECKRRAQAAGRPARWHDLIDEWWSRYTPHPDDQHHPV